MNKEILRLAIPSIFANITVPLVGIVDVAIAGHISDAAAIGGIAIGSMLFDLLYWNFGFLRVGTGGMTAQAFGRKDCQGMMDIFLQSISIALGAALFVFMIGWVFADVVLACTPCSPEVESFARQYFNVRIWAAPATLSLMVFKGWFIGTQNTVSPMVCDITVNVVNMITSYTLARHTPLGAIGVAHGTVVAQYTGLAVAVFLLYRGYGSYLKLLNFRASVGWKKLRHLLSLNGNLFLRSLCFMVIYVGFTTITSKYGDEELAVGAIMMKLFMLFSYFIDGFSYAGEALVGRFIGEKNRLAVNKAVRDLFAWSMGIGALFTVIYSASGDGMIRIMTSDPHTISASQHYLFWLTLMPLVSCAAFMWDGIYIGATAGKDIRNCMICAAAGFVTGYAALNGQIGVQAAYVGYFIHLIVRALYLTARWKSVLRKCLPALLLCFCLTAGAQNDSVTYQPVDSAYIAQIEQLMMEEKVRQAAEVVRQYEESMLKRELSFHNEGVNYLVRGLLSASKDKTFRNGNLTPLKKYDCDLADYGVAFSPLVATWGLKAFGVQSTSRPRRMVTANLLAIGMSSGITNALKSTVNSQRPNWKDSKSVPSGHTAMAFASATILHREYGYISPWISVGGYATATATQYLRLRHNTHWVTDIYMGAGIGVIATNFAYFVTDRIFGEDGLNRRPKLTKGDIERTVKFNTRPSSLSLTSGIEWGKEDKLHTSTSYTAGIEYSHFIDSHMAVEAIGRVSTATFYDNNRMVSGNIDRYHLDGAFKYSWIIMPTIRVSCRAFGGGRYMDMGLPETDREVRPEAGAGVGVDLMNKEKYTLGVSCDYSHTFSDWFTNRWTIGMEWKIIL